MKFLKCCADIWKNEGLFGKIVIGAMFLAAVGCLAILCVEAGG